MLVLATPWIVRFYARNERLGTVPETIAAGVTAFAIVDGGTLDVTEYFPRPADRPDIHYAVHFTEAGAYGIEPVASATRASTYGVTAWPVMPSRAAAASAWTIACSSLPRVASS